MINLLQRLRRVLSAVAHEWLRRRRQIYRPEQHYMRGPGPKARKTGAKTCQ